MSDTANTGEVLAVVEGQAIARILNQVGALQKGEIPIDQTIKFAEASGGETVIISDIETVSISGYDENNNPNQPVELDNTNKNNLSATTDAPTAKADLLDNKYPTYPNYRHLKLVVSTPSQKLPTNDGKVTIKPKVSNRFIKSAELNSLKNIHAKYLFPITLDERRRLKKEKEELKNAIEKNKAAEAKLTAAGVTPPTDNINNNPAPNVPSSTPSNKVYPDSYETMALKLGD